MNFYLQMLIRLWMGNLLSFPISGIALGTTNLLACKRSPSITSSALEDVQIHFLGARPFKWSRKRKCDPVLAAWEIVMCGIFCGWRSANGAAVWCFLK
jgi:hypothetical protein